MPRWNIFGKAKHAPPDQPKGGPRDIPQGVRDDAFEAGSDARPVVRDHRDISDDMGGQLPGQATPRPSTTMQRPNQERNLPAEEKAGKQVPKAKEVQREPEM